jgi:secreted Zn-dependent insulinase-like peptidase
MLTMKIITTLTFFILLHSSFTFANTHLIKINKSHIDSADYRYLTLSNGLKVVLIQKHGDSILNLTVNVGGIDDPDNYLGLAHYLEHMLHLGTTKHPRPDEYLNFIREKGGSLYALTFATQTQYHLSLPNQFFTEGIDRFSELFKSPLLNKKMAIKELNAVNSEWLQKKNTLAYNLHRTNSANMRSQSPFSRYARQ